MSIPILRTIVGNLAADPEAVKAGSATITKFRLLENASEFRDGRWHDYEPTGHNVEAWFELGENVLASVHKGDRVVVVAKEVTQKYEKNDEPRYTRVLLAEHVAVDLSIATAIITKKPREAREAREARQ